MQALVLSNGAVALEQVERPKPGRGEVLLRVACAGLCRTDQYVAQGLLPSESPRILGHECSGIVYRLGEGVDQQHLGARVAVFPWIGCGLCDYCLDDREKLRYLCPERKFLGWQVDGCFAEFLCVPMDRCIPLSDDISFQAGAYLEPVMAALAILRAPLKDAANKAILGKNRISQLTSALLTEMGKHPHEIVTEGDAPDNTFDLVIETSATESSLTDAMRILRPDGLLVLKSRPPENIAWPVRLQVEKEINTMALGYGTTKMALMLLQRRGHLFEDIWHQPVPLAQWEDAFQENDTEQESRKIFFLPSGRL